MGEYRRVYTKFELTAGSGRARRLVTGEGRGSGPDGYFSYASFSGVYHREGTTFTMYTLVRMDDGTQNLDKVVFDRFERKPTTMFISLDKDYLSKANLIIGPAYCGPFMAIYRRRVAGRYFFTLPTCLYHIGLCYSLSKSVRDLV